MFGADPSTNSGGIVTEEVDLRGWPTEQRAWLYWTWKWQEDSLLTVSGESLLLRPQCYTFIQNCRET